MIVFDLSCDAGHRFEGWFSSSDDFASQSADGLLICPLCGSENVAKAPMAPAVSAKANRGTQRVVISPDFQQVDSNIPPSIPIINKSLPPEVAKVVEKLAEVQARALKNSKWVGKDFADRSRAMHYGEQDQESIHGQATPEQAQDLLDEGISVAPLPFPVAPPEDLN